MPVTVKPSTHGASLILFPDQRPPENARDACQGDHRECPQHQRPAENAREVLQYACRQDQKECLELLQSSFDSELPPALLPSDNGFMRSVIKAYSDHHHLNIRPEDVWFAILAQLSTYINKHGEELREHFVAHEGKKELCIEFYGNRYSVDFAVFAEEMKDLLQKHIVDPDLKEWMMPAFSTTTKHDTVIASILMMGAMQEYFSYKCIISCGLPSVTLLGEKADWELILRKLDKLASFGQEPTQFSQLLRPVIKRFILSFDTPAAAEIVDFWQRIFGTTNQLSGLTVYSGWITAFCFWDEDGSSMYRLDDRKYNYSLHRVDQWGHPYLCLDGVYYHKLDSSKVPPGWSKVPVKVDDNGDLFDAVMIAGSVAISCTGGGDEVRDGLVGLDTVNAETGWWIFKTTTRPECATTISSDEEGPETKPSKQEPNQGRDTRIRSRTLRYCKQKLSTLNRLRC